MENKCLFNTIFFSFFIFNIAVKLYHELCEPLYA